MHTPSRGREQGKTTTEQDPSTKNDLPTASRTACPHQFGNRIYIDPKTGVLRNRLGIIDAAELAQAESELTSYRLIELRRTGLSGRYDLAHLQAFHRYIFGDLYDWAGELRSVSIGKGDLFCIPQHLGSFAEDVFGKLARAGHLRGLERAAFVDGLTALLADVNALHPFREGLDPVLAVVGVEGVRARR